MTADIDVGRVDWLAVEFVCNGTPMPLSSDPATLRAAILSIGFGLPAALVAARCGTNTRRVSRELERAGGVVCRYCQRYVLADDEVLPHHVRSNGQRCWMSGHRNTPERAETIRADQKKVVSFG